MSLIYKILEGLLSLVIALSGILLGLTLTEITFVKLHLLHQLIAQKQSLLIVLITSSVLLLAIRIAWHIFENPRRKRQLIYKTIAIENVNFIFNTNPWKFKVDRNGEDIMSTINPPGFRGGLVTEFPYSSDYIKIPEGYMYINFTLENHGDFLSVVDNIVLEVINIYKMPNTAKFNFYKPALQPEQDIVILNKDQKKYRIFDSNTYKYSKGDVDKFRLKVQITDKTEELIYRFKIVVYSRIGDKTSTIESDKTYFLSNHKGPSYDQVTEKEDETFNVTKLAMMNTDGREFSKCVLSLKEGNVREAREVLDKRIDFLNGLLKLRSTINDGDPPLEDCIYLRVYMNLYLKDTKSVNQDSSFIEQLLEPDDIQEFKKDLNNFRRLLEREEDSYKYLYEMSESMYSASRKNSKGNGVSIIGKVK